MSFSLGSRLGDNISGQTGRSHIDVPINHDPGMCCSCGMLERSICFVQHYS
jgi:hypothetical protein